MTELKISSPVIIKNRGPIPKKYTFDGDNVNPPLNIENVPKEAKSLVLIMDDPDAPMGTWVHWVVWNIPTKGIIEENSVPGIEGLNSFNDHSYGGPSPPSGTHRYYFKAYALNTKLEIDNNSRKEDVESAMEGHIIAKAELMGLYTRKK
ncbi:MAG: YbhB/YbcL family Raf kinase inhibitor-like protein [Candidatus Aenigmatarchaeota archaeon]